MKPELTNYFSLNATGKQGDIVISFFYEWKDSEDGRTLKSNKQMVSSVVLNIDAFAQFADNITNVKKLLDDLNAKAERGESQ